jgi:hypothetical protein
MDLSQVDSLLNRTPVISDIHPLSLVWFALPTQYVTDGSVFRRSLDNPLERVEGRYVIAKQNAQALGSRFPYVECSHNPFVAELSELLYRNFEYAMQHIPTVSDLALRIIDVAAEMDVVCLILIDGLSYGQVSDRSAIDSEPYLVDVPTLTEYAFPAIVKGGIIPHTLVPIGFDLRGFNYWSSERNELCARIFAGFSNSQVRQVISYGEVLKDLASLPTGKYYIQIVRMGLDQCSHHHFDEPDIETLVDGILSDIRSLRDVLKHQGRKVAIYAIADHGILWRTDPKLQVIENVIQHGNVHMRYFEQDEIGRTGRPWGEGGQIWQLDYPLLRRRFKSNEWGCHGGISFEESIVPLIRMEYT